MVTGLDYSVKTGKPALQKDEPDKDAFEILAADRIGHQTFNDAMGGLSEADGAAIVQAYDFSKFGSVIDVGGGHGTLAIMIARTAPRVRVRILDLPRVIDGTQKRIEEEGAKRQNRVDPGQFFRSGSRTGRSLCLETHYSRLGRRSFDAYSNQLPACPREGWPYSGMRNVDYS